MKWYLETWLHAVIFYGGLILTVVLPVIGSFYGVAYLVKIVSV